MRIPQPLVSCEWLAEHVGHPALRVLDASLYLPSAQRNARAEYAASHIPGAAFADIDALSDSMAPWPHTMPAAEVLAARLGALGVGPDHAVIVYDASGQFFSAPRLWWMLRSIGHTNVAVLDGGLARWRALGLPMSSTSPDWPAVQWSSGPAVAGFRSMREVEAAVVSGSSQVVDARSAGRFHGIEPEPRLGVRGGHIPGARHVHYAALSGPNHTLKSPEELRALFGAAGVAIDQPIIASCGSGVTACAVALALTVVGARDVSVYDGSWTEWGSSTEMPVER